MQEGSVVALFAMSTWYMGYFAVQDDFIPMFVAYSSMFLAYYGVYSFLVKQNKVAALRIISLLIALIYIPLLPNLSPDFYRFLWDGELVVAGIHPYAYTPNELIEMEGFITPYRLELYSQITDLSRANYSLYPTVNQFFFILPAYFTESVLHGVIAMRVLIFIALIPMIHWGGCLLDHLNMPKALIYLVVLNPLFVVEVVGNLHFEGPMLAFLMGSFYFLSKNRIVLAALFFAAAVNIKLTPLLLLPFVLQLKGIKVAMRFYVLTGVFSSGLLLVFLWPSVFDHFMQSIQLYFSNFEFNASLFAIFQSIFSPIWGAETIQVVGPFLSKVATVIIVFLAFDLPLKDSNKFFRYTVFAYAIFLFFSTTIHPWYLIVPLGLSVFTSIRFVFVWTYLIMLSYAFYTPSLAQVPGLLFVITSVQYAIVFVLLYMDVRGKQVVIE